MSIRVFLAQDSVARAVGADAVAHALRSEAARRGTAIDLVRTGSRGLYWLEPLVEVETPRGRYAYGPVAPHDVAALFSAGFLTGGGHRLSRGPTASIAWLAGQQRVTFARVGVIDPLSIDAYRAHGGFSGLSRALAMGGAAVCAAVADSGLRGRGGAGFPAGVKWRSVRAAQAACKYIVCNADEGDSGAFADRMLMEGDPYLLIEGMIIAGLSVGARQGYIYVRSEYPHARATLDAAVARAQGAGVLGADAAGSGQPFAIAVRSGAGAYICGEETALLESLEGGRGLVRAKPPLPAHAGLFGQPTLVHNVLTLAAVPTILTDGAGAYAALGSGRSRGTLTVQLGGNVMRGGLIETPFGVSLRTIIETFGGGARSGRPVRAAQVGGPLGAYLAPAQFDTPMDYESFAAIGAVLGHGGVVVFDDTVDMARQARFAYAFCAAESCGKCTPCRIGAVRGRQLMDRVLAGDGDPETMALLEDLNHVMAEASLCAMGGMTPIPVSSAMRHFPEDFSPAARAPAASRGSRP